MLVGSQKQCSADCCACIQQPSCLAGYKCCSGRTTMYLISYTPSYTRCRPTQAIPVQCGPASKPIAGSMPINRLRSWPNTGSVVYFATAPRQTRGIHPMLFQCRHHRLRRWPDIETALGDCLVSAGTVASLCR